MTLAKDRVRLYVALALLLVVALTYRVRDTVDRFDEAVRGDQIARIPFDIDLPKFTVTELEPEAQAAGLMLQDLIVGVAGRPLRGMNDLVPPLRRAAPGDAFAIDLESMRASARVRRTASIVLQPMRPGPPSAYDWTRFAIGNVALPYLCLALGFWVAAVRIRDKLAWLLLLLLLGLAEFVGANWRSLFGRDDWFQPIAVIYQPLLANLWPASMMLFGIYFPERLNVDRRYPWAKWIILAPILFRVAGTNVTLDLLVLDNLAAATAIDRIFGPMVRIVTVLHFVAISIFFVAIGRRAFAESRPDVRRRLMVLYAGASVSLTPVCILVILLLAGVRFAEWMLLPLYAFLFVFPATMAYVIVVHRAMDVRVVIRQGVQYVLARGSIRAIQLAASAVLVIVAASMQSSPDGNAPAAVRLALVVTALVAVVFIGQFAERLRRWVDRRFFREAYNAEQILAELATKVRTIVETKPLLQMVAHQISASLHVPRVAILLNGGGALEPAYAVGYAAIPRVPLREATLSDEGEREIREALDAELLLPLSANQKLLGVMGLGPKQSEEPFSRGDIRLLDAVAAQTGLALENSRLTAEIAAEVASREKAERELEIAREVQERLFPQEYPPICGIEYGGACRPALGVGGDYYDFIPISDTTLGIAIGDVSGKGIPAALLMATLRAYLHGQTIQGTSDLAALMANLNQLVYASSASNRYATFFYGQYDAAARVLDFVNAGHNPPMLFRAGGEVVRLETGGPVIGLFPDRTYERGRVTIGPGDVLVAFTDGISEAMNGAHEEWGEEQLADVVRAHRALSPPQLIDRIMRAADVFVAGASQHDDMTVVVVKGL
jgi:sigma-B regulation protein RsbU (phosphoserine phosphatase)